MVSGGVMRSDGHQPDENRWVLSLADTWRRQGARLIADGGISADDLMDALDATERA